MTNTPMTFEDYFKQTFPYGVRSAHTKDAMKAIWNACEANQQAEMDALKYDLDGYMKIAHASATEIVQQAQTIAELVEALEEIKLKTYEPKALVVLHAMNKINEIATKAIAKVKGK